MRWRGRRRDREMLEPVKGGLERRAQSVDESRVKEKVRIGEGGGGGGSDTLAASAFGGKTAHQSQSSLFSFIVRAIFFPISYVLIMMAQAGATLRQRAAHPFHSPGRPSSRKICSRKRGMDCRCDDVG